MKILGVSGEHDSGAALIVDGRIVSAANEERFNRKKLTTTFPRESIEAALAVSGIRADEIDRVALSSYIHIPESVWDWDQHPGVQTMILSFLHAARLERLVFGIDAGIRLVLAAHVALFLAPRMIQTRRLLASLGVRAPMRVIDHHLSHLASAWYTSGWDRGVALTVDASGDGLCSRAAMCEGVRMRPVNRIPFYHSPGLYYSYINKILGFKPGREGKVTGLAARGDAQKTIDFFRSQIQYRPDLFRFHNSGRYRKPQIDFLAGHLKGLSREDVSAGVQKILEETVCGYVRDTFAKLQLGKEKICLAGGVFANVRLNQEIAKLPEVSEVYIHPHMGDGGLAAGSALYLHAKLDPARSRPQRLDHVFFGPGMTESSILDSLRRHNLTYRKVDQPEMEAARQLAAGKCVAWCRGSMEYGPRALCHRTILYQATDPTVNDWLNRRLNRSEFMPFAPIVREERLKDYFIDYEESLYALEFMTITLYANDRCRREAPAIVHVDHTARPQLIREKTLPDVHRLLIEYERLTGLNILINTSYNMHEEPIVCTAEDSIDAFLQSRLDVIFLENYVVESTA